MTTATQHWSEQLPESACLEAVEWCQHYDTFNEAWQACERGDWMLWLVGHYAGEPGSDKRRPLVLAACECARLSLDQMPSRGRRHHDAIEIAEKWARGEDGVSLDNVQSAADAVYVVVLSATDAHAFHAAAAVSAVAASQTSYATYASYHSVKGGTRQTCADIVRKYYPAFEIGGR